MLHTSTSSTARRRPARRVTEVSVGALFLLSTAAFAGGSALLGRYSAAMTAGDERLLVAGAMLQMTCGIAVAVIGWLLYGVLVPLTPGRAAGYLGARLVECAVIIACSLWLLVTQTQVPDYELLIYGFTGLGGLLLASALMTTQLVHRWLAMLGLLGYAVLLAALPLDLLGLGELDALLGAALIPGGLFEIALPLLLIVRGFSPSSRSADDNHARRLSPIGVSLGGPSDHTQKRDPPCIHPSDWPGPPGSST